MPDPPQDAPSFDHLIHVVNDLEKTMELYGTIDSTGLDTHHALSMPGFRNAAWGIDDERYVELATIDDWDAVSELIYADSLAALRPLIEGTADPGLVTYAVNVPDARTTEEKLRDSGYEPHGVDVHIEDKNVGFTEVIVADAPAWLPFLITYSPPRAEIAAMRAAHRASQGEERPADRPDLVALLARSENPVSDARTLGELLECPVNGTTVRLPGAEIRFEPGTASELHGFAVRGLPSAATPVTVAGAVIVPEH